MKSLFHFLVIGQLSHWLCGCASAGTTHAVWNPSADPNVTGYIVDVSTNASMVPAVEISTVTNSAVITGLPSGTNFVTVRATSATATSDATAPAIAIVPTNGAVTLILKP